jgi:RNA polymerase sigma factor (sigma-70 family)
MSEKSDRQLLRDYAERGSEEAFHELVVRYTDLVYSAALRQVASPDLARDVAQTVFTDLARKARSLTQGQGRDSLVGWLYCGTRFATLNQLREERRRRARERQIMEEFEHASNNSNDWGRIQPLLDQVMGELSDEDREAVLLRFFKDRDFRSIGESLGISDDAAQKRVSRALDKLRDEFSRRGVTTTAVALGAAISANAVQVAPVGLAASLSSAALTCTSVSSIVSQTIAMTTMQKSLVAAALAVAAGAGIYEAHQTSRARGEAESARQQIVPLTERLKQMEREWDGLTNRLTLLAADNATLQSNSAELPRLRGELARLRRDSQQTAQSKTEASRDVAEAANSWANRVAQLKQRLAQTPRAGIPELQYVTEQDWLNAARGELNSDADYRRALSTLRGAAEGKFASMLQKALKNYRRANPHQMPTEITQLQPYFDNPADEAALERWQVAPAKTIQSLGLGGDVVITQKEPVDDVFDTCYGVGPSGSGSTDFLSREVAKTMDPVWEAFRNEHNGQWPDDVSQLQSYASTPEQQAALEKLVLKNSPGK